MHNVSSDQIERNIRLIQLVQKYPAIYNHDPAQNNGESAEEIWVKIAQDLGGESGTYSLISLSLLLKLIVLFVCF